MIVTILAFIPILLWLNVPSSQSRLAGFSTILASLGQLFGLVGVVLFSINLILSARLRLFDRYLNGLNNVYLKHNQIGQIALILLLFHPLLLISKYSVNIHEAALFLWLSDDWAINWGILALGIMIFLIVITLYLMPKYNIWKWTHKFLGLAFFLAALHVWLIPSDVSIYLPLRIYIISLAGLGLAAFLYKSILGRFLIKKYKYVVTDVKLANNLVIEIILRPQTEKITFSPGQFVFLNFKDSRIGLESHPFSLTSAPTDNEITFLIKNLGDYTKTLNDLTLGTIAEVEGPFGNFSFEKTIRKSQIWIAGGIGITPFISMAKDLPLDQGYKIDLLYCVRNENETVKFDLLENISAMSNGCFRVILFCSNSSGRITIDSIKNLAGSILEKEILICAPPAMIQSLKKTLTLNGVARKYIHSEEFSF